MTTLISLIAGNEINFNVATTCWSIWKKHEAIILFVKNSFFNFFKNLLDRYMLIERPILFTTNFLIYFELVKCTLQLFFLVTMQFNFTLMYFLSVPTANLFNSSLLTFSNVRVISQEVSNVLARLLNVKTYC